LVCLFFILCVLVWFRQYFGDIAFGVLLFVLFSLILIWVDVLCDVLSLVYLVSLGGVGVSSSLCCYSCGEKKCNVLFFGFWVLVWWGSICFFCEPFCLMVRCCLFAWFYLGMC